MTNDTPGLVAVSDDVDACVLQIKWPPTDSTPTVHHAYTLPALAYIAAGKTQRKHVLLGEMLVGRKDDDVFVIPLLSELLVS